MQLASVSQEVLAQANTKIIVIGCGDWQPIRNYLGQFDIAHSNIVLDGDA